MQISHDHENKGNLILENQKCYFRFSRIKEQAGDNFFAIVNYLQLSFPFCLAGADFFMLISALQK